MDNLETNTMILEQCRLEMDNLAVLGAAGMNDAVVKAEKRARICNQELRQATKAVELTAKQKKTVEDARLAGEEKLSAATQDEEDARIAAETVKRMIDDASNVRGASNKDTARILQRAEVVLDDTYQRAVRVYQEKKNQREEIEAAMLRLYATEKAVLYTMAKAERNEGEKLLTKIIADKKHQVCAAEYEVLLLAATEEELREKADDRQSALRRLEEEMRLANDRVEQAAGDLDQATADFVNQINACEKRNDEEQAALREEQKQYQKLRESTEAELVRAESLVEDKQTDHKAKEENLAQVQTQAEADLEAAKQEQAAGLAEEERQLSLLREEMSRNQAALTEAEVKYTAAQAEAERLRGLVNDFAARAAEAEAEEVSARDAAETANRLAENAIKIRESISSESSQLLLHAQEVLLEAAASAQQLMDEKSLLRAAAQNESDRIGKQAALAENTAQQAGELVEMKKTACQDIEAKLAKAQQLAEIQKAHLQAILDAAQDAAEERLQEARSLSEKAKSAVDEAIQNRDNVQTRLADLNHQIEDVGRRMQTAQEEGEERRLQLQSQSDQEVARLESQCRLAEAKVADLQSNYDQEQATLAGLERDITNIVAQIETASAAVREIIDAGVAAIQVAEEDVQRRCEEEKLAHQHAEEAVSQMSVATQQQVTAEEAPDVLTSLAEMIVEDGPAEPAEDGFGVRTVEQCSEDLTQDTTAVAGPVPTPQDEQHVIEQEEKTSPEAAAILDVDFERIIAQADALFADAAPQDNPTPADEGITPSTIDSVVAVPQEGQEIPAERDALETTGRHLDLGDHQVAIETQDEEPLIQDDSASELVPDALSQEKLSGSQDKQDTEEMQDKASPVLEEAPLIQEETPSIQEEASTIYSSAASLGSEEEPLIRDEVPCGQELEGLQKNTECSAVQESMENEAEKESELELEEEHEPPQERPKVGEVDEVAQAVIKAVSEAASRMSSEEDGEEPYDVKEFTADLKPVLEQNLGDAAAWRMTEMTEEERGRSSRLEDISAQLLEHTIIPLEEEESHRLYQPSDWLTNLARSLGEDSDETKETSGSDRDNPEQRTEIDLEPLINNKSEEDSGQPVAEGQIKVPQLELPSISSEEEDLRQSILKNESPAKPVTPKKRRFPFFN